MKEVWKNVDGYDHYQVSTFGNVRSLPRFITDVNGKTFMSKGVILSQSNTSTGYKKVELVDELGNKKSYKVHRLVAMAFIPNFEDKEDVNHKDSNRINNMATNLEWCTRKENMEHARANDRMTQYKCDKLDVNELKFLYLEQNMTLKALAKEKGVSVDVIYGIFKRNNIRKRGSK